MRNSEKPQRNIRAVEAWLHEINMIIYNFRVQVQVPTTLMFAFFSIFKYIKRTPKVRDLHKR